MNLQSIIVVIIMVALFALAVVWIAKNGGWQGGTCQGNCASCHKECSEKQSKSGQ